MQDKVIVITGAFGALGSAVATRAQAMGARTALIARASPPANLREDPLVIGGVDLRRSEDAENAMARILENAGRIDVLLNVAGGFSWTTLADSDDAMWERMHAVNLMTTVNASRAALKPLIEAKGAIVNVGAFGALKAGAGFGPYAASKEGVHKLTESLAEELKGKVRVNAVLPTTLDTEANRRDMPKADASKWVKLDDLARVMLFLASDEARAITGALVPVRGEV